MMKRLALSFVVLGPSVAGLVGCATPVEHRPRAAAYVGSSGSGWAAVLPTPEMAAFPGAVDGPESARRDYALAGGRDTSTLPPGAWPDYNRPTLDRYGRITFSKQPQTFIFFRPYAPSWDDTGGHR